MNLLYEVVHGSHLYGTNTSDSDLDIKGVYAPYSYDVLCGEESALNVISKANKGDNEKSDKDTYLLSTFFSLKSVAESPTLYPCACKPAKAHNMNTIKRILRFMGLKI